MTATPPIEMGRLLRLADTPAPPPEIRRGYGWCDRHQGVAYITNPVANDPVTGIHGTCKGCAEGRTPTRRDA